MSKRFISRGELRCSAISMILSQILLLAAIILHSIDVDAYDVKNEEEVLKLHNALSSPEHRIEIEIACVLLWIAFPLLLIGIYGFKEVFTSWAEAGNSGRIYMYLMEKAYIILVTLAMVLIPALSLVSVSYDWSFYESTANSEVVPAGYWIQLFIIIFELELVDCIVIADAVFFLSLGIWVQIFLYQSRNGNNVFKQIREVTNTKRKIFTKVEEYINAAMNLTYCIVFIIVLFEFANSGFFSINSKAKYVIVVSFIAKIFGALRMLYLTKFDIYNAVKNVCETQEDGLQTRVLNDSDNDNYQMQQININTNDNMQS
eukprot:223425_1